MTDALSIARDLIRCPSVTPADAGALGVLEKAAQAAAGFELPPRHLRRARHRRYRQSLCPHRHRGAAHHLCRPYRRGAARRRNRMDAWRVLRRGEGRLSLWPRRGRHEGRHRLQRRRGAAISRRQWRQAKRLDLVPDHRRRGRHLRQRHHQAVEMVRRARREIRPLRARRARPMSRCSATASRSAAAARSPARSMSTACRAMSPIRTAPPIRCRIFRG